MPNNLLTKNFILMFISNFLICTGFYMLLPILPVYAVNYLDISNNQVGIIIGIFALSAVLFRPLTGLLVDRVGRMAVYIPALILFALCSGGYALALTVPMLVFIRFVHGLSWSGVSTSNATIVADIIPRSIRGQGMGYFGFSMTIAMALGPAFGVFLAGRLSYFTIFVICMSVSLTALFASSFVRPPVVVNKGTVSLRPSALYEKRVFGLALMEFFYGFASAGVLSFATLHGIEMGIEGISSFFIVFAFFVGAVRLFGGKIMDRHGPVTLIYAGFIFYICGCVVLAFADNLFYFIISASLVGLGAGAILPTIMTMMMNVVSAGRRGAATATVFSALDVGIGSGAIIMGIIAHIVGYKGMYIFTALELLLPVLWFKFFEYKRYIAMFAEMRQTE